MGRGGACEPSQRWPVLEGVPDVTRAASGLTRGLVIPVGTGELVRRAGRAEAQAVVGAPEFLEQGGGEAAACSQLGGGRHKS